MRYARTLVVAAITVGLIVGLFGSAQRTREPDTPSVEAAVAAALGAKRVGAAYEQWVVGHEGNGGDRNVTVALGYSKGLSSTFSGAKGTARLNLIDGTVSVSVEGLPRNERWSVWLVDNQPGRSAKPKAGDRMIAVGVLTPVGNRLEVKANLGRPAFEEFLVDQIVVASAAAGPEEGVLFGSLPLFHRLYTALRNERLLAISDFRGQPGIAVAGGGGSLFGAAPATAQSIFIDRDVVLNALVEVGADLFINETFGGNGRTCATCHPASNNFTIDPLFIETLPDDDPLFVAERLPALAFTAGGPKFEIPVLMRQAGLIVENLDGFANPANRFTLRSVPHTLALNTSLAPGPGDGTTSPPNQRTGWSGDGAPGSGTLRDFATGAVRQHFTKTLNRVAGVDFRVPTNEELNAMEAFQLTLGRQVDLVLPLPLRGARAKKGQEIFLSDDARCSGCHSNAGANASFGGGGNRNFNTGIEAQLDRPAEVILLAQNILDITPGPNFPGNIPRDGGFGQVPGNGTTGFGNGTFNTPPLVEAADTAPFFHDNSLETIEGAISFYNSIAFAASPAGGGQPLNLSPIEVEMIGAFLRVINALENIREAREAAAAARSRPNIAIADGLLGRAITETDDAIKVLLPRGLHPIAIRHLRAARRDLAGVVGTAPAVRSLSVDTGLAHLVRALADMTD